MSVEYYYGNDLNMLYNVAVGGKTDGGKRHMRMMEAHANIEAHIQNLEHWRDTAQQLSKNCGYTQTRLDALEADYAVSNRELLIKQVEVDRLTAELAVLREQVRWIPVSERLPEYQQRVLFFSERISLGVHSEKARYWATDGYTYPGDWYNTVTHWMTLPQPPEAE